MNLMKHAVIALGLGCFLQAATLEDKVVELEKTVAELQKSVKEIKEKLEAPRGFRLKRGGRGHRGHGPHGSCHGRGKRGETWESKDIAIQSESVEIQTEPVEEELVTLEPIPSEVVFPEHKTTPA